MANKLALRQYSRGARVQICDVYGQIRALEFG
jgi:hypothetical protein